MPLLTKMKCDGRLLNGKPCPVEFLLGEPDTYKESAQMLNVVDAFGKKLYFHDIDCLRCWATNYTCPYLDPEVEPDPPPVRHIASVKKVN